MAVRCTADGDDDDDDGDAIGRRTKYICFASAAAVVRTRAEAQCDDRIYVYLYIYNILYTGWATVCFLMHVPTPLGTVYCFVIFFFYAEFDHKCCTSVVLINIKKNCLKQINGQ